MHITSSTAPYRDITTLARLIDVNTEAISLPTIRAGLMRLTLKLATILALAYGIHLVMDWTMAMAEQTDSDRLMIGVFAMLLLAYALLIAVPFMPGIEVGISLLMIKGAEIAPLVYLATILGLTIAYAAGRFLPHRWVRGLLADLRLRRACALVDRLAPMTREERLAHLSDRAPKWLGPMLGSGRYLLLAALINIPGNAVIGGGGGIAFAAGFSRLFRPSWTMLTFVLAVLPVPLTVWLTGSARMLL